MSYDHASSVKLEDGPKGVEILWLGAKADGGGRACGAYLFPIRHA